VKLRQERHIQKISLLTELENFFDWFLQRCRAYGAGNWRRQSSCATMLSMNESIYEQLRQQEQEKLDAAGLSDVKFHVGWFKVGNHLRLEARLTGPSASQKKARELLSFSDSE
jgi:hypothetical protein